MQPFWMCCIKSDVTLKLHGGNVSSTFTSQETVLLLRLYQVLNSETFVKRFTATKTLLWFTALLENCCYTLTSRGHFIIRPLFSWLKGQSSFPAVCLYLSCQSDTETWPRPPRVTDKK